MYLDEGGALGGADRLAATEVEIEHLRKQVRSLAFEPLPEGPGNRADALYVLGFPHNAGPSPAAINRRYRERAAIFHPDRTSGDDTQMRQINEAVRILRST